MYKGGAKVAKGLAGLIICKMFRLKFISLMVGIVELYLGIDLYSSNLLNGKKKGKQDSRKL